MEGNARGDRDVLGQDAAAVARDRDVLGQDAVPRAPLARHG